MKLRFALTALVAAAIAIPTIASAETTVIKKYGDRDHFRGARHEMSFRHDRDHFRGARNEMSFRHDRGLHRGWFHARDRGHKTIIIKKHGGDRD